jgi:hypothetical protein
MNIFIFVINEIIVLKNLEYPACCDYTCICVGTSQSFQVKSFLIKIITFEKEGLTLSFSITWFHLSNLI